MTNESGIPRISFKGVITFLFILAIGLLLLIKPLLLIGLSKKFSVYFATAVSSTIGMSVVLLYIDEKVKDSAVVKKRILLSSVVCFVLSYVLVFLTK